MAGPQEDMVAGPDAVIVGLWSTVIVVMMMIMPMVVAVIIVMGMTMRMAVAVRGVPVMGMIVRHDQHLSVLPA
jgi:hypothetical protein